MTTTRKQYSGKFKAKVAMEAIHGERTLIEIASRYQVHPIQVSQWKKAASEHLAEAFADGRQKARHRNEINKGSLFEEIGRLKFELDWL